MSHYYYKIKIQQGDVAFEVEATSPEFATTQLNKLAQEVLGITPVQAGPPVQMAQSVQSSAPQSAQSFSGYTLEEAIPAQVVSEQPATVETLAAIWPTEQVATQEPLPLAEPAIVSSEATEEDPQFDAFMDTLLSDLDNPASEIKLPFENVPPESVNDIPVPTESTATTPKPGLSTLNLSGLKEKKVQSFESVFSDAQLQLDVTGATDAESAVSPAGGASSSDALFNAKGHNLTSIETLQELCEVATNAKTAEDFLLLTGYFLQQYKATPTYSLKLINTELVRTGLTPINHAILENTVMLELIGMVPDLTGNAQSTEYELTADGIEHVKQLLGLI